MLISRFISWLRQPATTSVSVLTPSIDIVDDPDGWVRLVRVCGRVTPSALDELLRAVVDLTAPQQIHLDLVDARITDLPVMELLEQALDHLERCGITIRIVGIDPYHPAIAC